MRRLGYYHWDISFFRFLSLTLNALSIDQIFRTNPELFSPFLLLTLLALVIILILALTISQLGGWRQNTSSEPIQCSGGISVFLYLFKTILFIPLANIVIISIIPSVAESFSIDISGLEYGIGVLTALFFMVYCIYVVMFFR